MSVRITPAEGALACAAKIEAALKAFPASKWESRADWEAAKASLEDLILNEGGSTKEDWQGGVIRLWGCKATSTMGLTGAARNWVNQVRTKTGAQA